MALHFRMVLLLTFVASLATASVAHTATTPSPALSAYAEGLDAMMAARWQESIQAFSRALDTAGDDPSFVLARGVAYTLAEDFPHGLQDLGRAKRLGFRGREPELWTYVAEAMSGIVSKEHALGGFQGNSDRPAVVSIPGHIAQGGNDYPTDYGSFLVYQLGQAYQKHRMPADYGGSGDPAGMKSPQMRQAIAKAGQLFAERNLRQPELASLNLARARQAHPGQDPESAMVSIERALVTSPADPEVHYQAGQAWLAAGRPASARKEFTIALTLRTDYPTAYLGRAMAAARLGDEKRMDADLDVVKKGNWFSTWKDRGAVEDELDKFKTKGSAERLLSDLERAAQSGTPLEQLVDIATNVHNVTGEQRLRYDEIYQDRLRILEDAIRDSPKNPDKHAALAQYLIDESDNRGEQVEPRRELIPYRWQESREKELTRAVQIADQALQLNPKHVGGLIQKALALTGLKRYDQAETLADEALRVGGNNPDALRLYARFRSMRANQMSAEALSLRQERCSSSTHDDDKGSYIERTTTTTCYQPTRSDLNRADQLDAAAADLRRKARAAMEAAIKVTKGTVAGYLIQADLHLWDNQLGPAQAALQQAVKLDPKSLEAQDQLVQFYARTGQQDKAEEQQAIARRLIHTTAAPMLRLAWGRIGKTAWQGATTALVTARTLDSSDARTPAYLGVVLEGTGKTQEATAAFRTALALEEARLHLDESAARTDKAVSRDALDFGLAMEMRFRLASQLEKTGKAPEALELYQSAAGYEPRLARGWESRQMFTAMLPDQPSDGGAVVPAPRNAATLIAQAHLQIGKLLAKAGKPDEAAPHFSSAARLGPGRMKGIPMIGNAKGDTNFGGIAGAPSSEAALELAKAFLAQGDAQRASDALYEVGRNIPEPLRRDLNELQHAIAKASFTMRQPDLSGERDPERQRHADLQRQQDQTSMKIAMQYMATRAKVVPELVGVWELTPGNKFLPWNKTLTIQANADYMIVLKNDGSTTHGKMNVPSAQARSRTGSDPSRGQMDFYDESSGHMSTMWYEFVDSDTMTITDMDATTYKALRTR